MMHNFSQFINETHGTSGSVTSSELNNYISKVGKKLPRMVQNVLYLTQKYNILTSSDLEKIKLTPKDKFAAYAKQRGITIDDYTSLYDMIRGLGNNINLLPQYQSPADRESFLSGKLTIDDMTIDLSTPAGRNEAAKMYMNIVYAIVNAYVGKSRLSKEDLLSAGLEGYADALNNYGKNVDAENRVTFKTYAGFRVKQAILNEINKNGHTFSGTNWYSAKNVGFAFLDAISLDAVADNPDSKIDHLSGLGVEDKPMDRDEEKAWKKLYSLIEANFGQKDVNIFYRYFGLHGYKREKSKDIAKSYGMSEGNIRMSYINKMIAFLKRDRRAADILMDLQDMYNESLMFSLLNMSRENILETLINDDMYILLEELNKWNNRDVFIHSMYLAYENMEKDEIEVLNKIIDGDFNTLDDMYKKNKKIIVKFLKHMYPTENIAHKTDVSLLEYMQDIQNAYGKFKTKK